MVVRGVFLQGKIGSYVSLHRVERWFRGLGYVSGVPCFCFGFCHDGAGFCRHVVITRFGRAVVQMLYRLK